jgi:two-component system, NtrC family, response regulator HydG
MKRSLRILVVDDDIDNAQSLAELFDMEGHDAMVVHSGEAAIAAHMAQHFDLAFMDVMMPGLNGVESFLRIRQMKPHAKVFMMTGYSVEELLKQAVEQGALGVLNKPMDVDVILKMVNDVGTNGLMVAPSFGSDYGQALQGMIEASGKHCHIMKSASGSTHIAKDEGVLIVDLKTSLIDSVGVCNSLRREGHRHPTIIVTPPARHTENGQDALRDMTVTGILNKPFDPMVLLNRLNILAA